MFAQPNGSVFAEKENSYIAKPKIIKKLNTKNLKMKGQKSYTGYLTILFAD